MHRGNNKRLPSRSPDPETNKMRRLMSQDLGTDENPTSEVLHLRSELSLLQTELAQMKNQDTSSGGDEQNRSSTSSDTLDAMKWQAQKLATNITELTPSSDPYEAEIEFGRLKQQLSEYQQQFIEQSNQVAGLQSEISTLKDENAIHRQRNKALTRRLEEGGLLHFSVHHPPPLPRQPTSAAFSASSFSKDGEQTANDALASIKDATLSNEETSSSRASLGPTPLTYSQEETADAVPPTISSNSKAEAEGKTSSPDNGVIHRSASRYFQNIVEGAVNSLVEVDAGAAVETVGASASKTSATDSLSASPPPLVEEASTSGNTPSNSLNHEFDLLALYDSFFSDSGAAPKWFKEAFISLNVDTEFGPQYVSLIRLWMLYERSRGWRSPNRGLDPDCRPDELHTWVSVKKRKGNVDLPTSNLVRLFAERVWRWWCSLQPDWRGGSLNNRPAPIQQFGNDWHKLDKPGNNGWFGLIACLKWWRLGLNKLEPNESKKLMDDWLLVVEDISRMLQGLLDA